MAEKAAKKKPAKAKAKAAAQESGVLAALPSTRPARLSRRARPAASASPAKPAPKPRKAPAKRRPAAVKPKAKPATTEASVTSINEPPVSKPRPVRAGSHKLTDSTDKSTARRTSQPHIKPPSGTELVTTVVQAAGELAQVGLTVSGQIFKRAVERLPKP